MIDVEIDATVVAEAVVLTITVYVAWASWTHGHVCHACRGADCGDRPFNVVLDGVVVAAVAAHTGVVAVTTIVVQAVKAVVIVVATESWSPPWRGV